ncbi:MAG: DUF933 domain-containing protein, partial [Candidatus Heimdallarchaeota archaeon]|nr:DUF933 domain-containing protein [Candidatus Heimdallarchaeota archaeon]
VKILYNDWDRLAKKLESDRSKLAETIHDKLSGLGAKLSDIKRLLNSNNLLNQDPRKWTDDDKFKFAEQLRLLLFPMIIAANKMDMHNAEDNITKLKNKYGEFIIISTSGLAELTLRKANETEIIQYFPGSNDFKIINNNHKQVKVLQAIKEKILQPRGSTGVTNLLEIAVFELLEMIAVFPVEDGTHLTDHDGRILPDVFLVEKGTTAKEFAGKIHSDLAKSFIHGILPLNSNKRIAANYELENEDVVKIVSAAK